MKNLNTVRITEFKEFQNKELKNIKCQIQRIQRFKYKELKEVNEVSYFNTNFFFGMALQFEIHRGFAYNNFYIRNVKHKFLV